MEEKIKELINQLGVDIRDIRLLAIVTDTRSSVVFYGTVGGRLYQSNEMAEEGLADILAVDRVYKGVTDSLRDSAQFKDGKVNVLKYDEESGVQMEYHDEGISEYTIRSVWKNMM